MTKVTTRMWVGLLVLGVAAALAGHFAVQAEAKGGGPGCPGAHREHGGGPGRDDHRRDAEGFHYLLAHRAEIRRTVAEVPGGVETLTESDVAAVAQRLQEHVAAMYQRMKEGRPIHARDPLFAELFRNADKIAMTIDRTAKGVRVRETSTDAAVVPLIRRHAEVVSAFLANGHVEMMRNHAVPGPQP